jgi:low temperature requirement protein LtrA
MVLIGVGIIAAGFDQPLLLLVTSACVAAFMMFIYSALLIFLNRRLLPTELRPARYRVASLVWAVALLGILSAITVADQASKLLK